jgi:hypothetical protein
MGDQAQRLKQSPRGRSRSSDPGAAAPERLALRTGRAGLTAAGLLALQRTIGNAAATRALHRDATSTTLIQRQRKIGFELEDVKWRTWKDTAIEGAEGGQQASQAQPQPRYWRKPDDKRGIRPMTKREPLHVGHGFEMQADEYVDEGQLLSDIEFVTDPLPITENGYEALEGALKGIAEIYADIAPLAGREHGTGQFAGPSETHLSVNDARLSKGSKTATLKVQATQGLGLADIPTAYSALASPPSQALQPDVYALIQHAVVGDTDAATNKDLRSLVDAPQRALKLSMAYLAPHVPEDTPGFGGTDELLGLFTAAIAFVRAMRINQVVGGAKTLLPMMHRNDFATLFGLLPAKQKTWIQNNSQHFIDAVIAGVVGDPLPDDALQGLNVAAQRTTPVFDKFLIEHGDRKRFMSSTDMPGDLPSFLVFQDVGRRIQYSVLPPVTIADWVRGWIAGQNPKDLLTKAHFAEAATVAQTPVQHLDPVLQDIHDRLPEAARPLIDWARSTHSGTNVWLCFNFAQLNKEQKEILADYMRGIGEKGAQTDPDNPKLGLFENRVIGPTLYGGDIKKPFATAYSLPLDAAVTTVAEYFVGMKELLGQEPEPH